MKEMLKSCGCFRRKRRSSSIEDSSSCRSSELERGGEMTPRGGSLLKLFSPRGIYKGWRKGGRGMSMTKIERSKYSNEYNILLVSILGKFSIFLHCTIMRKVLLMLIQMGLLTSTNKRFLFNSFFYIIVTFILILRNYLCLS